MKKQIVFLLTLLAVTAFAYGRNEHEVVLHHSSSSQGHGLVYVEPPQVTYDEELNELYVYFGTTSTIDLVNVNSSGIPFFYVCGENHYGGDTATYTNLPSGYYTITIHSIYGVTYYGNFTVY